MIPNDKTAWVDVRIAPETLAIVKRAAELQGCSVNDFIVAAAQEAAHRAIEVIRLSIEDQRAVAAAILEPHAPNEALVRATGAHRSLIGFC